MRTHVFPRTMIGLLAAAWLLTEWLAFAQASRPDSAGGSISFTGRVEDAESQPLPGVPVCLCTRGLDVYNALLPPEHFPVDPARGRPADQDSFYFTTTQADGRFTFPAQRGKYMLLVSTKAGYAIANEAAASPPALPRAAFSRRTASCP